MTPATAPYRGLAGRRLALVESMLHDAFYQGIQDARAAGLEVWLLIRDRTWYGSPEAWRDHPLSRVDRLIEVDTHRLEAVLAVLTDRAGRPVVDGVTTFSDYHTELAARAARRLGLPGPPVAAVRAANQKNVLRRRLGTRRYNLPHRLVTDRRQLPAVAADLGFPLVAKPPAEAISYGVQLVPGYPELERAYGQLAAVRRSLRGQPRPGHVLVERYAAGVEVSVESLTVDGRTGIYGVTSKQLLPPPSFVEREHSFPVRLDPAGWLPLRDTVVDALAAIGYRHGPAHTEVMLTPDGPRLIEVNPRLPAHCITSMVRDVCGRDPQLDAMLLAVGGRPAPPDGKPRGGAAVVVLYPDRPGVFAGVGGTAAACGIPGVTVTLHARPGQRLWSRVDNSASVGFAYARAGSAAQALDRARRAAGLLTIQVQEQEVAAWAGRTG